MAASSSGDLRLEALSLLLHRSPVVAFIEVVLFMVVSRLMAVDVADVAAAAAAAVAAAAAAATSAAGRTTHDSYGLKLDRAVFGIAAMGIGWCGWTACNGRPGGEPPFEHDDDDDDRERDGECLSRPPPPPWSDDEDDMDDDVFLWGWW